MNQQPIAHISEDCRTHLLYDHQTGTAKRAAEMGAGVWMCGYRSDEL